MACYLRARLRTNQHTLRVTLEENDGAITLKLEGRVVGPWAAELGRFWEEASPAMKAKQLSLDLRDTTFADARGIRILRTIYSQTGAQILVGTPWTQYLAEEVTRNHDESGAGEA